MTSEWAGSKLLAARASLEVAGEAISLLASVSTLRLWTRNRMSYNGDAYKRRRVDDFSLYVAPSTSRTAAKARNDRLAQEQAARNAQTRPKEHSTAAPLVHLRLAAVPL